MSEKSLKVHVLSKDIWLCEDCNNYRGFIEEKYNGKVPVYCFCVFHEDKAKYGNWKSTRVICPRENQFVWDSCSQHKDSEGGWILTVDMTKGLTGNRKIMLENANNLWK